MKIQTSRFGEIEIEGDKTLCLADGLMGFPDVRRVIILEHRPGSPFRWLQSLDFPEIAFVIVDPLLVDAAYPMDIVMALLHDPEVTLETLAVAVIAFVPPEPEPISLNLMAPLAFNATSRLGAQVILTDAGYSSRFLIERSSSSMTVSSDDENSNPAEMTPQ